MDLPRLRSSANAASSSRPLSPPPTSCPLGPPDDSDAENDTPVITITAHVDSDNENDNADNAVADSGNAPLHSPPPTARRRDKRAPTVTPRRLAKFFRPRTSTTTRARAQSRALQELQQSGGDNVSRRLLLDIEMDPEMDELDEVGMDSPSRKRGSSSVEDLPASKRRMGPTDMGTPLGSPATATPSRKRMSMLDVSTESLDEALDSRQPPRRSSGGNNIRAFFGNRSVTRSLTANQPKGLSLDINPISLKPPVITRLAGQSSQRLLRELNFASTPGQYRLARPVADPRIAVAPFFSNETDSYPVFAYAPEQQATIPFSLAPCRRSPLVAIGDEQGCVRFLDISTDGTKYRLPRQRDAHNDNYNNDDDGDDAANGDDDDSPGGSGSSYRGDPERRIRSRVKVHDNAIMSLAFSHDDARLATACGDRNGTILDVATQAMAVSLEGAHVGPMRQVTFQPGAAAGNVLATSDRNGCIQIWDLRYSTGAQAQHWSAHDAETNAYTFRSDDLDHAAPTPIATADRAHARTVENNTSGASVTALSWFSLAGREHILLSASEANASIRVWDTRFIRHHTHRGHSTAVPLSATREPASHRWRSFGVTALALSDDAGASRLYAVCRDSTVYAYSATHLMLGTVPELNSNPARPRRSHIGTEDPTYAGLGPIYGFRHPQLRTQTFYVKCALRPTNGTDAQQQVLAVGSSENCAVLFPTDDRFIRAALASPPSASSSTHPLTAHNLSSATPTMTPNGSSASFSFSGSFSSLSSSSSPSSSSLNASDADVPIIHCGAALVGGHSREVTHMGWAAGGSGLVTASDDCTVRHWRADDHERARFLRTCGEGGGHRFGAGWAELGDFDDDDD